MPEQWPAGVARAREIVLAFGWNSTSYQIVNPGFRHWFSEAGDAVAGYVPYRGVRVVAGAPVCSITRLPSVVEEFESSSKAVGERVCYFGAEARLEHALSASADHAAVLLGAQPSWNPSDWERIVHSRSSLRAQLNRAVNKNVTIVEYSPEEAMLAKDLQNVLDRWLRGRGLPSLHFLVEPNTLHRLMDRRIFVARRDDPAGSDSVVAFAVLSPVPARNGWLVEQFPRLSNSPNGTIELLLTSAVRSIAASGATYVTLGLAPLAGREDPRVRDEPTWLRAALKFARLHGNRFYNFGGLESFKAKFQPNMWEPVYAIEAAREFSPMTLYAIAGAFASRSPLRLMSRAILGAAGQELRWLVAPRRTRSISIN